MKKSIKSMWRMAIALMLVLGMSLVMAGPALALTPPTVAVNPNTAGTVDAIYTIDFNVGAAGELGDGVDNITIVFPLGTVVDAGITGTVNSVPIVTVVGTPGTNTVVITTPVDIVRLHTNY